MHIRRNCHRYIWILSGTSVGPPIVKGLIAKGYEVSVSVVSVQASLAYSNMPLKNLWIGALKGKGAIRGVIENVFDEKLIFRSLFSLFGSNVDLPPPP